jgi:hypothetical protein
MVVKDDDVLKSIIDFMYNETKWNLKKPDLILSVIGGARKFNMPKRMKKAFKVGLIKAAEFTNSWILTSGFNSGVMKMVGEAINEYSNQLKLVSIGILPLNLVTYRERIIEVIFSFNFKLLTKE